MNVWAEKSIKIACAAGYLDELCKIYSPIPAADRPLSAEDKARIGTLHSKQKGMELVEFLLQLKRQKHPFPFEHPYISLLARKKPNLFKGNPRTVKAIGDMLLAMKPEFIIRGCERPADINRTMGPMFRNWLQSHFPSKGYAVVGRAEFHTAKGIAFLAGTDADIREYVNTKLGCDLTRGTDCLAKVATGRFVVAEARFLSTAGGSQDRDLRVTLDFATSKAGETIRVALLDGIVWFHSRYLEEIAKLKESEYALSALLLEDFLQTLRERYARGVE